MVDQERDREREREKDRGTGNLSGDDTLLLLDRMRDLTARTLHLQVHANPLSCNRKQLLIFYLCLLHSFLLLATFSSLSFDSIIAFLHCAYLNFFIF